MLAAIAAQEGGLKSDATHDGGGPGRTNAHHGTAEPPPRAAGQFSRLPAAAVFDRNVTNGNLRVLAALATYADKEGWCYPALGTLAKGLGVSRQAIQNHMRRLRLAGYVEAQVRRRPTGGFGPNLYRLIYPAVQAAPKSGLNDP
jgi:DNA-binding transcriptional ArsR family regulator